MSLQHQLRESLWNFKPETYFEDCLKIRDKNTGLIVPLKLNHSQKEIEQDCLRQQRLEKTIWEIVLKYRQGGISTWSAARIFHRCRFYGGTYMMVSHDLDSAEHIFGIIQRFYHYLPDCEKNVLKTVASNRKELKFSEPHGGRIIIDTAGKSTAGHSYTLDGLHLTEVSRWPEGTEDARAGLLNSLTPNAMVIVESVANGMSGWFYDQWEKKDSKYSKTFVPWFWQEEYKTDLPCENYAETLTHEEKKLIARYALTYEQVEWRRLAIKNKLDDDPRKFQEQYPSNPQEAFLFSGNAFFNMLALEAIETAEPMRGELRVYEDLSGRKELEFAPNTNGRARLWKKPKTSSNYVIGADPAEGIEIEGAPHNDKRDYTSLDVLDRETGEQVFQLHGHITPDELGRQTELIGRWYNNAFVGVESNAGYGEHALDILVDQCDYPSHLIYEHTKTEPNNTVRKKRGWKTTVSTRRQMLSELDRAMRKNELVLYCEETKKEMKSFITRPNGRIEHGDGKKDDRVFSLAIANKMLAFAPTADVLSAVKVEDGEVAKSYQPLRSIYDYVNRGRRPHARTGSAST